MSPVPSPSSVSSVLKRHLIFVSGKGGVGKTSVSQAIAHSLSIQGQRTLWVAFDDPLRPPGELRKLSPTLHYLNCEATIAFEEYSAMKIGAATLTRIFLQNKLVRYLAKATPGMHELFVLGKVWFERLNYDHVVVDMPSTGYGLAMFQSTKNFTRLFRGGPIHKDAEAMLETFANPTQTGFLIIAIPEEMPLQESLELNGFMLELFPKNPAAFLVNRRFPHSTESATPENSPESWENPIPTSAEDYVHKRVILEEYNLRLWRNAKIPIEEVAFILPTPQNQMIEGIASELKTRGHV